MTPTEAQPICLFLAGDVMTGRGLDQAMAHPSRPLLYEAYVRDARDYVALAERASGPIARPVDDAYVWGDALDTLAGARTDARIINLETSITVSEDAWPDKGIHYRMHPLNVGCLTAGRIDCCCLANNHVLDWGHAGLAETLDTLDAAGIARAGAGRDEAEATAPAILGVPGKGRVLVFSLGLDTSGIPPAWGAGPHRPGVWRLDDLSEATARRVTRRMRPLERPGDVLVASIHWGPNWGYAIPDAHVQFAHRLVEGGVDVVFGHSSHHVLASEIYRDRPILYGCGDLLDDYEGIIGYEAFRPDLRLLYLLRLEPGQGGLVDARLVPMQMRRFRLQRAAPADARWLAALLGELGGPFGTRVQLEPDGSLGLHRTRQRPASP